MLTDIDISEKLNKDFHDIYYSPENKLDINFSAHVLQERIWPFRLSPVLSFVIPKQLTPYMELVSIIIFFYFN